MRSGRGDDGRLEGLRIVVSPEQFFRLFPDGFVQQHILDATGRSRRSFALRVCIVIKLGSNGLISRIDE